MNLIIIRMLDSKNTIKARARSLCVCVWLLPGQIGRDREPSKGSRLLHARMHVGAARTSW
jgi:hypothetical protein